MTAIPAYCPRCKAIFPSPFSITTGGTAGIFGGNTNCLVCGSLEAKISEGIFKATEDAIELISGPESSREILEVLKRLAEKVSSGEINAAQAVEEARAISPKYAALLAVLAKFDKPAFALLFSLICMYLQYEGNKSSGEDAKKLLQAVTQQTFVMQQEIERRIRAEGNAPSSKKNELKSPHLKNGSGRRAQVNKQRREMLKKRRQDFGQRRPPCDG